MFNIGFGIGIHNARGSAIKVIVGELAGSAVGTGNARGLLTVTPVSVLLSGNATGRGDIIGNLTVIGNVALVGAATGTGNAVGNLTITSMSTLFTDDFTGDGNLEARPGWTFAFGTAPSATTTNGMLNATRSTPEAGYYAPDTGSINHYVQAVLMTVGANGPLICVDVQDVDNWVGVRNSASSYQILKKINGSVTVVGGPTYTPTVNDVVRLELRGRDLTLTINGANSYSASLLAGELSTETRPGIVLRTSNRAAWIDNWRSDKL